MEKNSHINKLSDLKGVVMNRQNDSCICIWSFGYFLVLLAASVILNGCSTVEKKSPFHISGNQDGLPVTIDERYLQPGLDAIYLFDKFRHVDHMPTSANGIAKYGRLAPPVLILDHRFGDEEVLDSGRSREVGVLLQGYFQLDTPGIYQFQAKSNDGFQLYIDGELIVSDPGVHGDRLSEPGKFKVINGGMFPVAIKYFQRKGTATLELYWQPPGSGSFSIVPQRVYLHMKK